MIQTNQIASLKLVTSSATQKMRMENLFQQEKQEEKQKKE
jgi:hypothetical protein